MFRKLALPINLSILLLTLLFSILKPATPSPVTAQPSASSLVENQVILSPFTHTYRIGLLEDISTLNVWAFHDTQQSVINDFVLDDFYPTLYRFSDQQRAWVPYIASDFPTPLLPDMGYVVSHVPLKADLQWSDGSPLTAVDVAFTINTAITMSLGGKWQAYDNAYLHHVEATTPLTLTLFYSVTPTIEQHQFGVLMGPIVSANYWTVPVANALAQANPINYLYNFIAANEPTAGPYTLLGRVQNVEILLVANPHYVLKGTTIQQYSDGTYEEINPFGTFTAYGNPTGFFDLSYVYGPYFDEIIYTIYATENEAVAALAANDIDTVLDAQALSLTDFADLSEEILIDGIENGRNQLHYLGLNHNQLPFSLTSFRQALSIWLDRRAILNIAGQDAVPSWDLLPAGHRFWYTPTTQIGATDSPGQRVEEAVMLLAEAGFTWDITPTWDVNSQSLMPGAGLHAPSDTLIPDLGLLVPSDDPLLAAVAIPFAQALNDLGLSITAVLTDTPTFINLIWTQQNFDLFLAEWDLGNTPGYLCPPFTSNSANISGYVNQIVEIECNNYLHAADIVSARQPLWQLQTTLANDLPYVPLFTEPLREAYRFDRVHYPYTAALDGLGGDKGLTAVARPVITAPLQPEVSTILIYTGTQGSRITVEVGAGSVTQPYVMLFTPRSVPGHPLPEGQQFINHAFDLEVPSFRWSAFLPYMSFNPGADNALTGNSYLPFVIRNSENGLMAIASTSPPPTIVHDSFTFLQPITITVHYLDDDVTAVDEDTLKLLYWSDGQWYDAGTTCSPDTPSYANDPNTNILLVNICHFSRFATSGN